MKERLAGLGCLAFARFARRFGKFIAADTEKWARVVRAVGIKAQ